MSNFLKDLVSNVSKQSISKLASKINIPEDKVSELNKKAFSLFLTGMGENIAKKSGEAEKIVKTLEKKHRGEPDFKNMEFLKNEGQKIFEKIFAEKKKKVLKAFAKDSKLAKSEAENFLKLSSTLFMNSLEKTKSKVNANSDVLSSLISMATEALQNNKEYKKLLSFVDINKNGTIKDELLKIFGFFFFF